GRWCVGPAARALRVPRRRLQALGGAARWRTRQRSRNCDLERPESRRLLLLARLREPDVREREARSERPGCAEPDRPRRRLHAAKPGRPAMRRRSEKGFTLIEVLIAMS